VALPLVHAKTPTERQNAKGFLRAFGTRFSFGGFDFLLAFWRESWLSQKPLRS